MDYAEHLKLVTKPDISGVKFVAWWLRDESEYMGFWFDSAAVCEPRFDFVTNEVNADVKYIDVASDLFVCPAFKL